MFELVIRVVLASGAMAAAGLLGRPNFDLTWRAALLFAAYSFVAYIMERRKLSNPGTAGLVAVADCGIATVLLADLGLLSQIGFLGAAPMAWAFFRYRSNAAMMAPLAASWLLVGANLFGGGTAFTASLLVQALGVLLAGLAMEQARVVINDRRQATATAELEPESEPKYNPEPLKLLEAEEPEPDPATVSASDYEEFKESFRTLSDTARDIERRSRRDRAAVQIFETVVRDRKDPFASLADKMLALTGADGVGLYTVTQAGATLVPRSCSGHVEDAVQETSVDIPKRTMDTEMGDHIQTMLSAARDPSATDRFATVLLRAQGRLHGMLTLFHTSGIELEAAVRKAEETADFTAELICDQVSREEDRRRMHEAELLYTVATTVSGANTPTTLASRVVRDLWHTLRLDHLAVHLLDGGKSAVAACEGNDVELLDSITFARGVGLEGWLESGSPLVAMTNAHDDARLPADLALKKRIGSFVLVPLEIGAEPLGYLTAATSRVGGIDTGELETLRVIAAETTQALARLQSEGRGPEGLATPSEFWEIIKRSGVGHLVYLEVPRREDLAKTYGSPAIDHAIRRFAVRMRSELPEGAAICRRDQGDYVVYLCSTDEEYVRAWANDVTALASMVGVRTLDGRSRIPLALRAKVALVNQQNHQLSREKAA